MDKEHIRLAASEKIGDFLLENVHRTVYGKENLDIARQHLQEGSIFLYFPDFAKLNAILYGRIVREHLTSFDNLAAIIALKHLDGERGLGNKVEGAIMKDWEKVYGVTIIPMIQNGDGHYEDSDHFNTRSLKQAAKFLRTPGHVLAIAPEGTRSKDNQLHKAQEGFEVLFKLGGKNVLALPLAGVHGPIRPMNTNTTVIAGKPFSYQDLLHDQELNPNVSLTDLAMVRMAKLLPTPNQGEYRDLVTSVRAA